MNDSEKVYDIKRNDFSTDRSLRSHSAADEYLLSNWNSLIKKPSHLAIYNDRFGYLTAYLNSFNPTIVLTTKSQEKSIHLNLKGNNLPLPQFSNPLSPFTENIEFALMKAPKSLALFELFLQQISQNSTKEVTVVAAFMTRHFTPKLLEIAQKYFEDVVQSKAVKKARLVTLTKKKEVEMLDLLDTLDYNNQTYKQYPGVFSANHIDYATQYLLEHLELKPTDHCILDLAAGNGVIGKEIMLKLPTAEIHLIDDAYLAVESAKLNVQGKNIHHHFENNLSNFEDGTFDLIVTNPPFHFEYEININLPIQLFKECFRCLKVNGNVQVVANKHLNYATHLKPIFTTVEVLGQNDKYIIYKCVK